MSDGWLTRENARVEAEQKVEALRRRAARGTVTVTSEAEAWAVSEINYSSLEVIRHLFDTSVGVVFPDAPGDHETWYITSAKEAKGNLAVEQVIPWTHWLGRVATRLRNAYERGETLSSIVYGPVGKEKDLPVGPLVDYVFVDGRITEIDFIDKSTPALSAPSAAVEAEPAPLEITREELDEEQRFGLKTIIQTLDDAQDDQIRGPMDGVFVFTGGPGVGKTTVALHRIPYLINEQNRAQEWSPTFRDEDAALFFTANKTLVVVWKEHLVSYLRTCVHDLVDGFPDRNVRHIDKWVTDILRGYVNLGRNGWRLRDPEPWFDALKRSLEENDIQSFLRSNHSVRLDTEAAIRDKLPQNFSATLTKRLDDLRILPRMPLTMASPSFSLAALERLERSLLKRIPDPRAIEGLSEMQYAELRDARQQIREAISTASQQMIRHVDLLFEFYRSDFVSDTIRESAGGETAQRFLDTLTAQQQGRSLSRTDTYLLIWLIHLVTDESESKSGRSKPLPRYTHVVIDEAQYYEPLVLRLFGELVGLPEGVLTIVGDLEQRISADGGILSWGDVGFDFGTDRIKRLVTNFRWTREVFDFLELFHLAANVQESLARPIHYRILGGRQPEIHTLDDHDMELDAVVDRISELRNDESSKHWTITVVVPDELVESTPRKLVSRLEEHFIEARWATDEDVKEHVDRVVVTNYSSIVGLEFDCVFMLGTQHRLARATRDGIQSAWVALTRARRFVSVMRTEPDDIFDQQAFREYHVS